MNLSRNPFFTHGIDKLCRICQLILKDADSTHSIFSTVEDLESPMNLMQVLQSFSNFNFYNGPQMVCKWCYDKTVEVYKFIEMCNKADEIMQHYLKDVEATKPIRDETDIEVKVEEISIGPTRITIDGSEFSIAHTEIVTVEKTDSSDFDNLRVEKIDEQMHDARLGLNYSKDCHLVFATESSLNTDIHVHTGEKPFTCLTCKRDFTASSSLRRHMDSNNGVKAHKCEQCDRRFTQASHLRAHMDRHNGVKAHKCEQCDRRFTVVSDLRRHMLIHSGVKAHKCEQCDRRFTHVANLRSHMVIHKGVKAHKCEQCNRRFTHASYLRKHMMIHNGIKANKCGQSDRRFTQASELRSHMDIHKGVNAHKCGLAQAHDDITKLSYKYDKRFAVRRT